MNIVKTEFEHLKTLMAWFPDKGSSYSWCGPGLRYPFTKETFLEDIHWEKMPTYSLVNDDNQLVGFGQHYEKFGRCHLARFAASPDYRSKGIGRNFINKLITIGLKDLKDLKVNERSLFVLNSNEKALSCHRSLNFKIAGYPQQQEHFSDISFMLRELSE